MTDEQVHEIKMAVEAFGNMVLFAGSWQLVETVAKIVEIVERDDD